MTDATAPAGALTPNYDLQWGKALSALRRLLRDKEDTAAVFEIMRALNGRSTARGYHRLLRQPAGGRLAYDRLELSERLNDPAYLAALPDGSVGAGYRDFLRRNGFDPTGLVQVSQVGSPQIETRHPYAWFGRRTRDVHDLWHVLTGYETDGLGEACLVAFSYAQTGGLGWLLIAIGAGLRAVQMGGWRQARAIIDAYKRGRRAAWLQGEDYERLLVEPIDRARARLGLTSPTAYLAIPPEERNPI